MNIQKSVFVFITMSFVAACTTAPVQMNSSKLEHTYISLKMVDIDEMTTMIDERVNQYRASEDIAKINEALLIDLSRPNEDNIAGRLMTSLRNAVEDTEKWEAVQAKLINSSIDALDDSKTAAVDQVTYLVVLQNWLGETKPELSREDIDTKFELSLVEQIADANIQVSEAAAKESALNLMNRLRSPSLIANDILIELNKRPAQD